MFNTLKDFISFISAGLAVVVTIFSIIINNKTSELDAKLKDLDAKTKQQELQQKDLQFGRDFKFKMYDEVAASIADKNTKKQQVAVALVTALLNDTSDIDFRNALLSVFLTSDSVNKNLKAKIDSNLTNEKLFIEQQRSADSSAQKRRVAQSNTLPENLKWDVDIFYNEATMPLSLTRANKIEELLKNQYHTRVRVLSSLTNARSGYGIFDNEIRYNNNDAEHKEALNIQKVLGGSNFSFNLNISYTNTPSYLSIFVQ